MVKHYLLHCRLHNAIRSTTIHQLNYNINIEILLKGCPLYDDRVNGEIFVAVHNFIQNRSAFWLTFITHSNLICFDIGILSCTNNPIKLCNFCIVPWQTWLYTTVQVCTSSENFFKLPLLGAPPSKMGEPYSNHFVCLSIRPSVCLSVCPSVCPHFVVTR